MMGKLIWLMGPSGSGKDSLLAELRLREQTQLLVAHRYITRDASAGSENHIALSEQEFFTRAGQNLLALSWHANGLYYGARVACRFATPSMRMATAPACSAANAMAATISGLSSGLSGTGWQETIRPPLAAIF